jgi:signal transduction histidine kinase
MYAPLKRRRSPAQQPRVPDVVVALAVAGWVWAASAVADEPSSSPPAMIGWVLGVTLGGLQLARRRRPLTVLGLSAAAVVAYHAAGYPGIGTAWPLVLPYLGAAAAGHLAPAAGLALALSATGVLWRLLAEGETVLPVLTGGVQDLGVAALALAVGEVVRQRRRWTDEAAARVAATEEAARQRTRQAVTAQRLALAADLHDVAGHSLVRIGLQLRLAEEFLDGDQAACRRALAAALAAHGEALAETTATVRLLHADDGAGTAPFAPGPGLTQLPDLVSVAADAGVDLRLDVPDDLGRNVSAAVGLVVYRISREALTNTLRHSPNRRAQLDLQLDGDALRLRFRDSGPAGVPAAQPEEPGRGLGGHGIEGMRARVAGLGGTLHAGASGDGYIVEARLPLAVPAVR